MKKIISLLCLIYILIPNYILSSEQPTDKDVGIYDIYLGEDFKSILKKCIDKGYYVIINSNYEIPNEFLKYVNENVHFLIGGDLTSNIDKINGKYLNLINNKTTTSALINGKYTSIKTNIPGNTELLNKYISEMVRDFPMPAGFLGGSLSQYVPDILNKLGIKCNSEYLKNIYNKKFSDFIDEVSRNNNNKYDIKKIDLKINDQFLSLFFMNSPGANINDILFFIRFNVTKVFRDDNVRSKIKDIFINRYGNPEDITRYINYYNLKDNIIIYEDVYAENIYYFINKNIINYYIQSSNMLYEKYKEMNNNNSIKGM